ncbi:Os03g0257700 [Oryza sativa Japonica Group]|uniref:Os03g0257700 protein n=2 Tax=Oryza sativa subsp. japonica TaxID=39947 RepID=Q0DTC0_ORYSJ|nr:hypothetical protein EE612_016585 [Oryza sativa]BAF11518.1 Os03g0257700 [Oryza sativa Japonica Group]BAS83334.1 Os03g0257700 [Oryza sativa Japonica Group]|eukprot:NP_001049604.1 Os03g0257700 [Oryza sativa Japonica Group]
MSSTSSMLSSSMTCSACRNRTRRLLLAEESLRVSGKAKAWHGHTRRRARSRWPMERSCATSPRAMERRPRRGRRATATRAAASLIRDLSLAVCFEEALLPPKRPIAPAATRCDGGVRSGGECGGGGGVASYPSLIPPALESWIGALWRAAARGESAKEKKIEGQVACLFWSPSIRWKNVGPILVFLPCQHIKINW